MHKIYSIFSSVAAHACIHERFLAHTNTKLQKFTPTPPSSSSAQERCCRLVCAFYASLASRAFTQKETERHLAQPKKKKTNLHMIFDFCFCAQLQRSVSVSLRMLSQSGSAPYSLSLSFSLCMAASFGRRRHRCLNAHLSSSRKRIRLPQRTENGRTRVHCMREKFAQTIRARAGGAAFSAWQRALSHST